MNLKYHYWILCYHLCNAKEICEWQSRLPFNILLWETSTVHKMLNNLIVNTIQRVLTIVLSLCNPNSYQDAEHSYHWESSLRPFQSTSAPFSNGKHCFYDFFSFLFCHHRVVLPVLDFCINGTKECALFCD